MKTKTFKIMIAAIVVCSAMLFTACTKEDNPGGTGSSGIAMIVKDGQIDYWRQIETAFRDACQEKGLEAYYYATSAEKAYEEQLAAVTNAKQGEMVPTFYMTESNLHDAVVQPFLKFYYKQVYDTIDGITQAQ